MKKLKIISIVVSVLTSLGLNLTAFSMDKKKERKTTEFNILNNDSSRSINKTKDLEESSHSEKSANLSQKTSDLINEIKKKEKISPLTSIETIKKRMNRIKKSEISGQNSLQNKDDYLFEQFEQIRKEFNILDRNRNLGYNNLEEENFNPVEEKYPENFLDIDKNEEENFNPINARFLENFYNEFKSERYLKNNILSEDSIETLSNKELNEELNKLKIQENLRNSEIAQNLIKNFFNNNKNEEENVKPSDESFFKNFNNNNNVLDFDSAINNKNFDDNLYATVYYSTWNKLKEDIQKLKNKLENNKIPVKTYFENGRMILKSEIIEDIYNNLLNLFEIKYYPSRNEFIIQSNNKGKLGQKEILKFFNINANKHHLKKYEEITYNAMKFLKYLEHVNNTNNTKMFKEDLIKSYDLINGIVKNFPALLVDFLGVC